MDRKPRRLRAGQIHLLPPADHTAGRAPGVRPRRGLRGAKLHPHLAADAGDPVLPNALTISAGGVEESDGHVHNSTLPQHGKEPVLHPSEDHRELKQTPLHPCGETRRTDHSQRSKTVNGACSGIHELFIKYKILKGPAQSALNYRFI